MTNHPLHIVFAGGGTGGHLFPGLAVAERLVDEVPQVRITFAGSGKAFEQRHVAAAGFEYLALPCRPLLKGAREAFSFIAKNLAGYLAAGRFLAGQHVAAVVGLGGYASVPMAQAAGRRGVPLILLEQNATAGKATRWLSRSASLICLALAPARSKLRCRCPIRVTGTPIRSGFFPRRASRHRMIVLGGSGGARSLNEKVPRALHQIQPILAGWQIVHQTGESGFQPTCELYDKLGLKATVVPFIADVPAMLRASGLAVCRSGGTTLAELAAAGVPAVLLPYPHATDDHQRLNAEVFCDAGGAVTLDTRPRSGRLVHDLTERLSDLIADADGRARMSAAMRRLARPHAADEVAGLIVEMVQRRCAALDEATAPARLPDRPPTTPSPCGIPA